MIGSVVLMCGNGLHVWFGSFSWLLQWRTVTRPVNLAQASQSRLGEMKQGARLSFFARNVARAARSTFERAGNSPKREGSRLSEIPCCHALVFFVLSPRREGGSPERDPSAWARCWARLCYDLDVWCLPSDLFWLGMIVWWWTCM